MGYAGESGQDVEETVSLAWMKAENTGAAEAEKDPGGQSSWTPIPSSIPLPFTYPP